MPQISVYAAVVIVAILSFGLGWIAQKNRNTRLNGRAQLFRDRIVAEAKREAETMRKAAVIEAKDEFYQLRKKFEGETEIVRREQSRRQDLLDQREDNLSKKVAFIDNKESRLERQDEELKEQLSQVEKERKSLAEVLAEQNLKLEHIAGLTADNAKRMLMDNMIADARHAAAMSIKQIREESERQAKREAHKILSVAVQRYAAEHVAEESVSVVDLPNDEMKGRIIGREGRNIRAFELATGVDVIIDDTPEAVIISGFDPVRREIAYLSLQKLIRDGRIHPGRIEEIVAKTREEMQERIRELGEQACLEVGIQNINPDMFYYIGRLQYRSSYGQNLLLHSKEVAAVSAIIASELGLDPKVARRCGFLHDIGKSADHEIDGPHALIGGKLCKKYGETDVIINAVAGHHQDLDAISPYTYITAAADAVSASRPGARRESLETYIKRLENLEQIADSFDGVEKSYAIQAGREIRILVNHNRIQDAEPALVEEADSRRVEGELEYPGHIKVMVIRETRATAYARQIGTIADLGVDLETRLLRGDVVRDAVLAELRECLKLAPRPPGLAVVLVGDDPASAIYVRHKEKACEELGYHHITHKLPTSVAEDELLGLIADLNRDERIDGILVQMPLPRRLDAERILQSVDPRKDVDGFHPENLGRLAAGRPRFIPCTPLGILRLLEHYEIPLSGREVAIVGRSVIVGRPLALLLSLKREDANATVTLCHSGTQNLASVTRRAGVVVAAMGVPMALGSDHFGKGAVVVDVGINRVPAPQAKKGTRLVGDVDATAVMGRISALTPVPGGVGPLTIAMLMQNTWLAMTGVGEA